MTNRGRATGPQYHNDMTKEELKEKIASIDRLADTAKKAACLEYVQTNAKYKIGDIIVRGPEFIIRVEKITYCIEGGDIIIYYYGTRMTKDGKTFKCGEKAYVSEKRIK